MGIGSIVSVAVGSFGFGISLFDLPEILKNPTEQNAIALMWMNNVSQLFTFLFPVVTFLWLFGKGSTHHLKFKPVTILILLAGVIFILVSGGLIDLSSQLNKMLIPAGSGFERWAKPLEESAEQLTKLILNTSGTVAVISTFISIAVIPAVCEELAFRGVMQALMAKSTSNIHIAIWVTAVAFSLFHMQFYGFLPRVIIGALLGYLVIWTGSIWPSILAHFANNATAFLLYKQYNSLEAPEDSIQNEWYVYVLSFLLTIGMIFWFRKNSKWPWDSFEYLGITKKNAGTEV